MRPNRLGLRSIAAWLGLVALALNALTPVHLAFDLAHALAPSRQHAAAHHDLVGCLLTVLIGHHEDEDQTPAGKGHHDHGCAVCGAIGTLAGFALPPAVLLVTPACVDAQVLALADPAAPPSAFPAAYRSRAPPLDATSG